MREWGRYITKHLISFAVFILGLLIFNILVYGLTFHKVMMEDLGDSAPQSMLEATAAAASPEKLTNDAIQSLRQHHIWAIYLDAYGQCYWSVNLPDDVPKSYTLQDVALFSKGYIADYPVFIRNTQDGLLVLGYPKDSYTKLTSNYYSIETLKRLPVFVAIIFVLDIVCLFLAYYFSKRRIIKNTEPIVIAVETLAEGKPAALHVSGELSGIADSINKASFILNRQNKARANWISGVSHDIRTPLSMIMGYACRIEENSAAASDIRQQAKIVRRQSEKIKELIQDLNLVSQLEYEMQPLHKESVRLSRLLRSYIADLLNSGISDVFSVEIKISPECEDMILECDARLISRAVNNLVQNSMKHNPQGCKIFFSLTQEINQLILSITDNGIGLSEEKLQELEEKPHYMESTDQRLNLRHGLGLLITQQIAEAHHGTLKITNHQPKGCQATLMFPILQDR